MRCLSAIRTARVISVILALLGGVVLVVSLVFLKLLTLLPMAQGMVNDGLSLYNSFTGRMAVQNIAGHKELLQQLKEMAALLPSESLVGMASVVLVVMVVMSILLLMAAVLGFVKPAWMVSLFVKIRILKESSDLEETDSLELSQILEKVGNVPLKKLLPPAGILLGVLVIAFTIAGIVSLSKPSSEEAMQELEQQALEYVTAQKNFFWKNKGIGSAKDLMLQDSSWTKSFSYKVTATQFTATNQVDLEGCSAGNIWKITSRVEGAFTKKLKLYRSSPKDANCVKLLPHFKDIGRKPKESGK